MAVALVAALATFQRFPAGSEAVPAPLAALFAAEGATTRDALSARFGFCHSGGGRDCVVDGHTFWVAGEKHRVADIDTPVTHPARRAEEAALGDAENGWLRDSLKAGAFSIGSTACAHDRDGSKLRIVTRDGASGGSSLVAWDL